MAGATARAARCGEAKLEHKFAASAPVAASADRKEQSDKQEAYAGDLCRPWKMAL